VRRAVSLLVWFALLEALWALFIGTQQDTEVVAGLLAAAVGAVLVEALRTRGLLSYRADYRMLAQAWKLPFQVVLDFAVVTRVLGRSLVARRRIRGEWVDAEFEVGAAETGRWQRAFGIVVGTTTPNAIVVDLRRDRALLHSLDTSVSSGRKVL
jgi:hypothetical protein